MTGTGPGLHPRVVAAPSLRSTVMVDVHGSLSQFVAAVGGTVLDLRATTEATRIDPCRPLVEEADRG